MSPKILTLLTAICLPFVLFSQNFPSGVYTTTSQIANKKPSYTSVNSFEVKTVAGSKDKLKHKDSGLEKVVYQYKINMDKSLKKKFKENPPLLIVLNKEIYLNEKLMNPKSTGNKILNAQLITATTYTKAIDNGAYIIFPLSNTSNTTVGNYGGGMNHTTTVQNKSFTGIGLLNPETGKMIRIENKKKMETLLSQFDGLEKKYQNESSPRKTGTLLYYSMQVNKELK